MLIEVEGVLFPHHDPGPDTIKHVRSLVSNANKHRKKIVRKLRAAGNGSDKFKTQNAYLGSSLVKISALVEAAKGLPLQQRKPISDYVALAETLKMHSTIDETVNYYLKPKHSGKYRCICVFGVRHKAAQKIVGDLVNAQFIPRPFQFNVARRGVKLAIRKTRKLIEQGLVHASCLDIGSFFDKFDHVQLMASGITEKKVMEYVVIGKHYEMKPLLMKGGIGQGGHSLYQLHEAYLHSHGIAQGSVCSPSIANFYISKLNPQLPKDARVLNYADDFLVLAKSGESLEKARKALKASVEALSVGSFELLEKSGSSMSTGFAFLGHQFVQGSEGLQVYLTDQVIERQAIVTGLQNDRFHALLAKKNGASKSGADASLVDAQIVDLLIDWARTIKGWQSAYSEVNDIEEHIAFHRDMLIDCCEKVGLDGEELFAKAKAYAEGSLVYGQEGIFSGPEY